MDDSQRRIVGMRLTVDGLASSQYIFKLFDAGEEGITLRSRQHYCLCMSHGLSPVPSLSVYA